MIFPLYEKFYISADFYDCLSSEYKHEKLKRYVLSGNFWYTLSVQTFAFTLNWIHFLK